MDRNAQVGWIRELAANIAFGADDQGCPAEDLVEYVLSDEGRDSCGIELPEWFDDHDRMLLVRFVTESLS